MSDRVPSALAAAQVGEWDIDLESGEVALSPWSRRLLDLPSFGPVNLDALGDANLGMPAGAFRRVIRADPGTGFIRQIHRCSSAEGVARWLELRGTIFRNSDGKPVRVMGVILDVTEREEHIQVLEQNWRRFEAALANTSVVIFEQDAALRYTWIHNPPMGYEAYRLIGKNDVEVMGEEFGAPIAAMKQQVLATGQAIQAEVTVPVDGGVGRYDLHIEPLRDCQGVVVGVACAAIALDGSDDEGGRQPSPPRRTLEDRDFLLDRIGSRLDSRHGRRGLVPIGTSALERKLAGYTELSAAERAQLSTLELQCRFISGRELLDLGAGDFGAICLVGSGWAYSYDLLADGRRQIIGFHLPGDLIGHGNILVTGGRHLHATNGDLLLCSLNQEALSELMCSRTTLARALRWAAVRDAAIIEQHLVSIGRRSADARLAHLLLELGDRLEAVQLADSGGYRCPLTQELIADALGLTNVHVNRLVRRLRDQGLLTFVRGFVAFKDKPRLIELAEYDPAFLDLPNRR